MNNKLSILLVDNDKQLVMTLQKLLNVVFPNVKILTAHDGNAAWSLLNAHQPQIALIDLSIPGHSGLEIIQKVRNHDNLKETYIIVLTATSDQNQRTMAIEQGADDSLQKPIQQERFVMRLRTAVKFINLQYKYKEENQLLIALASQLENDIQDMIKLSVKFLQARLPASTEMLKRVADASVWIAKTYGDFEAEDLRNLEIAAFLSQAGRIFLPDHLLKTPVMIDGRPSDQIMSQVPISGKEIVSSVARFKDVADIILHVYENFDGSGIPNRLQSWQIPFASRIIRVALDYEEIRERTSKRPKDVLAILKNDSNRFYDPRVVTLLEHFTKSFNKEEFDPNERAIQVIEMKPEYTLTRDLVTVNGLKLLPAGTLLTQHLIDKVIAHASNDPILAGVFVKKF